MCVLSEYGKLFCSIQKQAIIQYKIHQAYATWRTLLGNVWFYTILYICLFVCYWKISIEVFAQLYRCHECDLVIDAKYSNTIYALCWIRFVFTFSRNENVGEEGGIGWENVCVIVFWSRNKSPKTNFMSSIWKIIN